MTDPVPGPSDKAPNGHKSYLDDEEWVKRFVLRVQAGNYIAAVCRSMRVNESTYYKWIKRAEDAASRPEEEGGPFIDTPYSQFAEAVSAAEADAEIAALAHINKAAIDGTWTAAAWFLERKYPERWGRTDKTLLAGAPGGSPIPVKVEVEYVDDAPEFPIPDLGDAGAEYENEDDPAQTPAPP